MKTTILLGYAKTDGSGNPLGKAEIISGPPENDSARLAQAKLFSDAKQRHKFPKGVKHLAFCVVESTDAAAHISDDIGEEIEARETLRSATIAEENKKRDEKNAGVKALQDAQKRIGQAAVKHNDATAALNDAKRRLLDAEANFKATKLDRHKEELETAKQKVAELTKTVSDAAAELDSAKAAKADLLKPKTI